MFLLPRDVAAQLGLETVAILDRGFYVAPSGRRVDVRDLVDAAVRGTVEYPPDRDVPLPPGGGTVTGIAVENAKHESCGLLLGSPTHRAVESHAPSH